ncbi:MAG TPA: 30S ribosome-binding factor RbfA [Firmicutes bacterium]|nr:30S ribosome-binding factor RbfA [Bacillota bacterium]
MSSLKTKRIASQIAREISVILNEEAKNEVLKMVSITDVTVDDDLTFAKVYFMTRLDNTKFVEQELNEAARFIRKELAHSLDLRSTPELKFVYDKSLDIGERIEDIIEEINEKEEKKQC